MDVSIIIINYNTKDLLFNCIKSIYKNTDHIDFEIIVVDNNSNDNSDQMILNNFPEVRLIKLPKNVGFGKANNEGVKIAKGKYLFFLNSDTILLNNAIKVFFDFMENHLPNLKIGAIGSLLVNKNYHIIHSFRHLPQIYKDIISDLKSNIINIMIGKERYFRFKTWLKNSLRKKENNYFFNDNNFFEVGYVTGADLFMAKELFVELGGFDNNFFMYYEESDLQYRMKKKGFISVIINGPLIQHLEGASFRSNSAKQSITKKIYYDTSHFYYYKKNFNSFIYNMYHIVYTLIQLIWIFDTSYSFKDRLKYIKFLISYK